MAQRMLHRDKHIGFRVASQIKRFCRLCDFTHSEVISLEKFKREVSENDVPMVRPSIRLTGKLVAKSVIFKTYPLSKFKNWSSPRFFLQTRKYELQKAAKLYCDAQLGETIEWMKLNIYDEQRHHLAAASQTPSYNERYLTNKYKHSFKFVDTISHSRLLTDVDVCFKCILFFFFVLSYRVAVAPLSHFYTQFE